jgi:hypothetical protein
MTEELKKAVIRSLEKNHKNGPLTARNLAGIYEHIIKQNASLSADQIAALIHEEDVKGDSEDEAGDDD